LSSLRISRFAIESGLHEDGKTINQNAKTSVPARKLNRADVEQQLKETSGPEYWRSLEELAGSPEFQDMLHREFPKGASEWVDSVSAAGSSS